MLKNDPNVGSPRNRVDGRAKVTGSAQYSAEFDAPDLAHGYVVSSSVARGRIAKIETQAAEAVPGVVKVFTHENRPRTAWFSHNYSDEVAPPGKAFRPLYNNEVIYSGQPIALVVADDFEAARYAASLIDVAYDVEPHETDLRLVRAKAYVPPKKRSGITPPPKPRGDAMKAYSEAPARIWGEYAIATEHHNPMEPHVSTVVWEGKGKLTIHDKIQGVLNTQGYVASVFGLSKDEIHVVSPFVGGGFGSG
ncbi:MAG: molybdopterin cofactor-binding domain-containing protein, partial [Microvirga sp.]